MSVDIKKIEKLMTLMTRHNVDVIQAETKGEKITLSRNAAVPVAANAHGLEKSVSQATVSQTMVSEAAKTEAAPAGETITSPFVGTFYRSSGPTNPPFVEVGSRVKQGQTLCIVEAMKLMNEIESEIDGEIVAILAENGKPVQFGTPLFVIAKSAS